MGEGAVGLASWGYHGIFLSVVLGNAGLPIPEDAVHLAAGYLAAAGQLALSTTLAVGILSVMAADQAGYWAGRLLRRRRGRHPEPGAGLAARLFTVLQRHGPLGVFVARFVPGVRSLAGPIAGLAGVSPLRFLAANGSAALIHVSLLTGAGYALGARVAPQPLAFDLGGVTRLAAGALLCLVLAFALGGRILHRAGSAAPAPPALGSGGHANPLSPS